MMKDRIHARLTEVFTPQVLEVVDESEKHRGHAGYREGGGSHFAVKMRARALNGKNRLAQQRAVYAALRAEMAEQIHALSLDVAGDS